MGDLSQFKTGLELLDSIMVQLVEHNGLVLLQVIVQKNMNKTKPFVSGAGSRFKPVWFMNRYYFILLFIYFFQII